MKTLIKFAGLLTVMLLLTAGAAKADSISYQLIGPGFNISFSLPEHPTSGFFVLPGNDIEFDNVSGIFNGVPTSQLTVYYVSSTSLTFVQPGLDLLEGVFPTGHGPFFFGGPQLYSGNASSPTLLAGTFLLGPGGVDVLTATRTPEPSSLLLLAMGGLALLGLSLKRLA